MGKNTHGFRDLIDRERKENERQIRLTKRPIFNLWRLTLDPCNQCNCNGPHRYAYESMEPMGNLMLVLCVIVAAIATFITRGTNTAFIISFGALVAALFGLFHTANNLSWTEHEQELKKARNALLAKTDGDFLYATLERLILQTKERLFGKESEFSRWTELLEGRKKEIGQPTENVPNSEGKKPYRDPAQTTHVRVVPEIDTFLRAREDHQAFGKDADEKITRLLKRASVLKRATDGMMRVRKRPHAEKAAEAEISTLELGIQEGVNEITVQLKLLEETTADQNGASARASADSYSSEAVRETQKIMAALEEEEAVDPSLRRNA
mgnify:CR=1 FL=1